MDVILGAGIAGLGAYAANNNREIFEAEDSAGGLCDGFAINGFRFDKAVHLSFTNIPIVRERFDKIKQFNHHPVPYSWYHEKWLKHPAQNNLFPCSADEKVQAIKSFIERNTNVEADNFEAWNRCKYGEYLYENLFKPYNEKYWCVKLDELGVEWIGNRIYQPTLEEVLYGSYTSDTPNTYYAKEMRYPEHGGYRDFIAPIIEDAERKGKIHYGKKVERISVGEKSIYFQDGDKVTYDKLMSSIPLSEMINIVDDTPQHLIEKVKTLEWSSVVLVSIGLNKPIDTSRMWVYIYDTDIMAARAYFPSTKSKNNVPEGSSSIQFEIYFNAKKNAPAKEKCIQNCIYALEKMGLATAQEILFSDYRILKYGNVIFKKGTEEKAQELTNYYRDKGIHCIGRFGEWKYLWSDQSFMSGYCSV